MMHERRFRELSSDKRKSSAIIKPADIEYLLNIGESLHKYTRSTIMETFGEFNGKVRFRPYDIIEIPAGSYGPEGKKNKNKFTTTVGIWIFNKYFIEQDLFEIFGYINKTVDGDEYGYMNQILSYALAENRIELEIFKRYNLKYQLFMDYVCILSPNFTDKILTCTRAINIKKRELLKKYKKELDAGDYMVGYKMEKELLEYAKEYMKGDPSMDIYLSGARGSINNNFKNMFVMKGIIKDPNPNAKVPYKVATSNYIDGISAEEYALFATSLTEGPYARAIKTANGGYLEKLFVNGLQHIHAGPEDSDCGTPYTITVQLDKKNILSYMYSYIKEGNKLIELNSQNMDKYIGKTVHFRFSSLCQSKNGEKCSKCIGTSFYKIGKENIGAATPKIPSTLKNIAMKSFHNSVKEFVEVDLDKIF